MTTVRKGNEKNTTTIKVKSEGVRVMVYSTTFNKNGTIKVKVSYIVAKTKREGEVKWAIFVIGKGN
jgi:hypothetical protein